MTPKTLTTTLLTTMIASTAAADVVTSYYHSSSNYGFELEGMPDFDQVRDSLAVDGDGDPGGMYCVPTGLTNLLGYAGMHGFEDLMRGGADWEAQEDYDYVTTIIANMASLAGTTGTGGTYHAPAYEAMSYFLQCRTPGVFNVTENLATNTTGPTLRSISENNINGAISSLCYGIYDELGEDIWGRLALERNGGHCVSFVRGYRNGSSREIEYMDPDDNNNSSTQSNFGAESYDVEAVNFVYAESLWDAWLRGDRTGSRIMRTSGGKYRMIDSVIHIRPRACYSWDSSEQQWNIIWAGDLINWADASNVVQSYAESIRDFTIGPLNNRLWYLDAEASQAYSVALSSNDVESFDLPHATHQLAFARDHALLALGHGQLSRLHPYAQSMENAPEQLTLQIPADVTCMASDPQSNALWLAGMRTDAIYMMSQQLDAPLSEIQMPQDWPIDVVCTDMATSPRQIEGQPHNGIDLAMQGADGRVHLCKLVDNRLYTTAVLWNTPAESDVQFNDEGDVVLFSNQKMRLFRLSEQGWIEVQDHPFANQQFASRTVMSRSSTNFDANLHNTDAWTQVRDLEPIQGDVDGDGQVSVTDLLEVIAAFGEQNSDADIDGDGWVTVEDMLILISNWSS